MNANAVAKHYDKLTPEERFRLMLAASGRGDEAERERLEKTSGRIGLYFPDYTFHDHAFKTLALLVFIELTEDAAKCVEAMVRDDPGDLLDADAEMEKEGGVVKGEIDAKQAESADGGRSFLQETWAEFALALATMLKTKADGWKLFCERLNVPPFLKWEPLPGFKRLKRLLTLAEEAAFTPDEHLQWLNSIRPAESPELTQDMIRFTAERVATQFEDGFRKAAKHCGGR